MFVTKRQAVHYVASVLRAAAAGSGHLLVPQAPGVATMDLSFIDEVLVVVGHGSATNQKKLPHDLVGGSTGEGLVAKGMAGSKQEEVLGRFRVGGSVHAQTQCAWGNIGP